MPALSRFLASCCLFLALPAFAADTLTGVVTNGTTKKPSAGDDVVLIRLQQGMQESTRTKTDSKGHFTLEVPDTGIHLVRVTHDKANYFRPAPPGTQSVEVEVFNAAAKVQGVSNEADVMRIQSDAGGNALRVVENFFVKNESTPPLTQFSERPFEFWLPEGAIVEGSAALAPGGMPVQAAPVPLAEKGHYTFLFPIRPGETRFQITYRLPYSGKFSFAPHVTQATDTVAIMLPKSMTFTPAADAPFAPVNDEVNAQTFVARNVAASQSLSFTLSGSGQLPRDADSPGGPGQGAQGATPGAESGQVVPETQNTAPGRGLQNPLDPEGDRDPWGRYKWWILGGLALLLAAAAGVLLKKPSAHAVETNATPAPVPAHVIDHDTLMFQALKEELFSLETERLQNRISEHDYSSTKAALELILSRALARSSAKQVVSV